MAPVACAAAIPFALSHICNVRANAKSTLSALRGCSPSWSGEVDLHRVAVQRLLPVLVRRRAMCQRLIRLPEWRELVDAVAVQVQPMSLVV